MKWTFCGPEILRKLPQNRILRSILPYIFTMLSGVGLTWPWLFAVVTQSMNPDRPRPLPWVPLHKTLGTWASRWSMGMKAGFRGEYAPLLWTPVTQRRTLAHLRKSNNSGCYFWTNSWVMTGFGRKERNPPNQKNPKCHKCQGLGEFARRLSSLLITKAVKCAASWSVIPSPASKSMMAILISGWCACLDLAD